MKNHLFANTEQKWQVNGLEFILFSLATLFLLLFLLMMTHLRIELICKSEKEGNQGYILFSIFKGFVQYRLQISKIDFKGIEEGVEIETKSETHQSTKRRITMRTIGKARHALQEFLERVTHFQGTVRWFLSKVICEKLLWTARIGTGDAVETGVVVGMAWGVISPIIGFFGGYIQWRNVPELQITPLFSQIKLENDLHIIIRFRVGNAIYGISRLILQVRKKKEVQKWANTLSKA